MARRSGSTVGTAQPLFTQGDVDGFFGLAIDNLIQFLLILSLCTHVLGFPLALVLETILPGAALSIVVGNFFYSWQSQRLSAATGRRDVTALPYGINTVSLFAFVLLVMLPVKLAAQNAGIAEPAAARLAWQLGLAACLLSGLIELVGAFVAEQVRRSTPRAALLSTLAGIAVSFIAIDFAIKTFAAPLVAMLPLGVILTTYFSHTTLPWRIPGGAWALLLGSAAAWLLAAVGEPSPVSAARLGDAVRTVGIYWPVPAVGDLVAGLTHPLLRQFLVPGRPADGTVQRARLAAEHRVGRGGRRFLSDHAVAGGERHRLDGGGVLRLVLPDHDLHRPPGLEGARRTLRLLDAERRLLRRHRARRAHLPDQRAGADGSGHGDRAVDRHHDHRAGVPEPRRRRTLRRSRSASFPPSRLGGAGADADARRRRRRDQGSRPRRARPRRSGRVPAGRAATSTAWSRSRRASWSPAWCGRR